MTCRHCGKEISAKASFCSWCGTKVTKESELIKKRTPIFNFLFPPIFFGLLLTAGAFSAALCPILLLPIILVGVCYARFLWEKLKSCIGYVPNKENISKCNRCGSTNIKIYRNGYNYSHGFWGAMFGVKGAGYAGGFDANRARCRCMNCGKDWLTDYDYRLIK